MKTKTANIRVNHIFGTKNGCAIDVSCRGRLIKPFECHWAEHKTVLAKARTFAHAQGFTHCNVNLG